jgi:hypothetical protein
MREGGRAKWEIGRMNGAGVIEKHRRRRYGLPRDFQSVRAIKETSGEAISRFAARLARSAVRFCDALLGMDSISIRVDRLME